MDDGLLEMAKGIIIGLVLTGIYGIIVSAFKRRVNISSPESRVIEQVVPAVNALIRSQGPMLQGTIAIMEALKGQCNGNVDAALAVNRKAKEEFDEFLTKSAEIKGE